MTINEITQKIINDVSNPENDSKYAFEYEIFHYRHFTAYLQVSRMYKKGHVDFYIHVRNRKLKLKKFNKRLLVRRHAIKLEEGDIKYTLRDLFINYCTAEKIEELDFVSPEVERDYINKNKIKQAKMNVSKAKQKYNDCNGKIIITTAIIESYEKSEKMYKELIQNIQTYKILNIYKSREYPLIDYIVEIARTEMSKSKFYIIYDSKIDLSECTDKKDAMIQYGLETTRKINTEEAKEEIKEICIQELIDIPNAIINKRIYLKELEYDLKKCSSKINHYQERLKNLKEGS